MVDIWKTKSQQEVNFNIRIEEIHQFLIVSPDEVTKALREVVLKHSPHEHCTAHHGSHIPEHISALHSHYSLFFLLVQLASPTPLYIRKVSVDIDKDR